MGWILPPGGNRFSRILPDGRVDLTFEPNTVPWFHSGEISFQNDGKIILAGWVESVTSGCYRTLTRLSVNGSVDTAFAFPPACRPKDEVSGGPTHLVVFSDNSMLVSWNSQRGRRISSRACMSIRMARKLGNPGCGDALQNRPFITLVPTSGSRILVGGQGVVRLLANGTEDPTFHLTGVSWVQRIVFQGDKLLVLDIAGHLHRFKSDGSADASLRCQFCRSTPIKSNIEGTAWVAKVRPHSVSVPGETHLRHG